MGLSTTLPRSSLRTKLKALGSVCLLAAVPHVALGSQNDMPPQPAVTAAPTPQASAFVDKTEINTRINDLMRRPEMVGLSVAIIENGQITFAKGYGRTERGGDKVTADTVFRWASVSKGVGAAAALLLAEDGYFGLNSPIKAFAPSLDLPPAQDGLTLEDILSQRSGMIRNAYDRRIEDGQSARFIRASLSGVRSVCEPGQCYSYQNVLYDTVSEMIETVTKLPYKAVVSERIFKPLGMDSASLTLEGLSRSRSWAKPHNSRGAQYRGVKPTYYRVPAAAGVNSSITDLAKWTLANMSEDGSVLSPSLQTELQTGRIDTPRENRNMRRHFKALTNSEYALGWRTYDYDGHAVVGHRGAVQGYRASVLFDPELQTGVVMLWNSSTGRPNGLQLEIFDQVYGSPKRDWMRLRQKW